MGSVGPHQIRRAAASGGSLEERGRVAVAKLDEGGQQPQFYRMDVCGRHGAGSDEVLQSAAGVALDASQHFAIIRLIAAVLVGLAADHAIDSFDRFPTAWAPARYGARPGHAVS